ncbi:MAG: adenylate/guanylate cyclase domain-containing protein [Acidobacteriota bacterium]
MPRLSYVLDGRERSFAVRKDRVRIGRMEDNDLVISDHTVSREHAEIVNTDKGWMIRDVGSSNGLCVNGLRMDSTALAFGDVVSMGRVQLSFLRSEEDAMVEMSPDDTGSILELEGTVVRSAKDFQAMLEAEEERRAGSARAPGSRTEAGVGRLFSVLTELSRILLSAEGEQEVLERIMDAIFQNVTVQRGALLLKEARSGELVHRVVRTLKREEDTIRISRTIARKVAEEGVAVICTDAQSDRRFSAGQSIKLQGIRSALCVPLKVGEKILGLIYLDTPLQSGAYTEFEADLVSALAGYGAVAVQQTELREGLERERLARSRLQRYHSPSVVDRILASGRSHPTGGLEAKEAEVTVLFADIVGFSTLSERLAPEEVGRMLNVFFSRMTEIIFDHEGTLDKFIGDAVMAVFGAPIPQDDHALMAVRCALAMRAALPGLAWESSWGPPLNFRVGINTGRVVAGDIGGLRRMEYSVLGNAVNIASRLQSEAAAPGQIVLGEETFRSVKGSFRCKMLKEVRLKGISKPVSAYEVTS